MQERSATPNRRGAIAEAAIAVAALRLGIDVYRPVAGAGRCDLVFDTGSTLLRVQCKTATRRGGALIVQCNSTRRSAQGFTKHPYSASEIDLIAAYAPALDRCYALIPSVFSDRAYVQLRLEPPRNNQSSGIRWAADHALESLHWDELTGP